MLLQGWDVAYSFGIRYKHLLVNSQGLRETDEDIDHILRVDGGGEGSADEDERGSGDEDDRESGSAEGRDGEGDGGDSEGDVDRGGLNSRYLPLQYPDPQRTHVPLPKQQKGQLDEGKQHGREPPMRPQPPSHINESHRGYSQPYAYGPPLDPWGRPMPYSSGPEAYNGHGGYGMYSYGGYNPPPDSADRYPSQPREYNGYAHHYTTPPAPSPPDLTRNTRKRTHDPPSSSSSSSKRPHRATPSFPLPPPTEVKHESPDVDARTHTRDSSVGESVAPTTEMGERYSAAASVAALEAELRATELELKVARLQARRAALRVQGGAK